MAVNHVVLTEFHATRQVPYFVDYLKRYTDCPLLVELHETPDGLKPGEFLRAGRSAEVAQVVFHEFATHETNGRGVPVRRIETADGGHALVATVYDLLFPQFRLGRGLPGAYPQR